MAHCGYYVPITACFKVVHSSYTAAMYKQLTKFIKKHGQGLVEKVGGTGQNSSEAAETGHVPCTCLPSGVVRYARLEFL